MKKIFPIFILCLGFVSAQVFTTAQNLSRGKFNITLAPIVLAHGGSNLGLYTLFGIGVGRGLDIGFNLRLAEDVSPVFGADIEFALLRGSPAISLSGGAHVFRNGVGMDATFNLTFVIRKIISIYFGVNNDFDFYDDDVYIPLWVYTGIDVMIKRNFGIIFEIDINVLDNAPHVFGTGIAVYF